MGVTNALSDHEYSGKCVCLDDYWSSRHSMDKMYSSQSLINRQHGIDWHLLGAKPGCTDGSQYPGKLNIQVPSGEVLPSY